MYDYQYIPAGGNFTHDERPQSLALWIEDYGDREWERENIGTILPMRVNVERCIKRENDSVPETDIVWLQDNGKQSFHGILRLDQMRDPKLHCAKAK